MSDSDALPTDPSPEAQHSDDANSTPPARRRGGARVRHERRKKRTTRVDLQSDETAPPSTPPTASRPPRRVSLESAAPADTDRTAPPAPRERPPRSRPRMEASPVLDWLPQAAQRVQQVRPSGGLQMPDLRLLRTTLPLLYVLGGLGFVLLVIFVLGALSGDTEEIPANALWVSTEWTYLPHGDGEVARFAFSLQDAGIGTIYAFASLLRADNTWAGSQDARASFSNAQPEVEAFLADFRAAYPDATVYAWLSIPVSIGDTGYRLDDPAVHQAVADFSLELVQVMGFDGVFLNVRDVYNDNGDDFMALLQAVRRALPTGGRLAVAIPPDWTPADESVPRAGFIAPGTLWARELKQRVALMTDEMAIMAYNSGLDDPNDYADWVAHQVQEYSAALIDLDVESGPSLLVSIPTYDSEPPWHLTTAENVSTAVTGVLRALNESPQTAQVLRGLAVFQSADIDADEWIEYRELWWERTP